MGRIASTEDVFRAIADRSRRTIISLLEESDQTVTQLNDHFEMSQAAVSQHLRVLRDAGLVKSVRSGRHQVYTLQASGLREVFDWVSHFERFWDDKLDALERHLDKKANRTRPATGTGKK